MDEVTGPTQSAYPSHRPPVAVRLTVTGDHPCSYFPDRTSRTRAFWAPTIPANLYHKFMDAGFRRSGRVIYQPVCPRCRDCVPIRVPVDTFTPDKTQRRIWRKNQDLLVTAAAPPEPSEEKHRLYEKYRKHWHAADDLHDWNSFVSFLYESPAQTLEMTYRDPAGALLGVGICDLCPHSLSSVYFYFDPDHARRSLGTFSALWELDLAKRNNIPHYYLGYWVTGCGTMEYKSNFRPFELLGTDGVWRPGR